MKMLKKICIFIVLVIFTSCDSGTTNISFDKGILIRKSEYFGRFDVEVYKFNVLYKGKVYKQNVEKSVYNQYNIKDTVELVVNTTSNKNTIFTILPKNP